MDHRGNRRFPVRGGSVAWQTPQASELLRNLMFPSSTVSGIVLTGPTFSVADVSPSDSQLVLNAGSFYHRVPISGDATVSLVGNSFSTL